MLFSVLAVVGGSARKHIYAFLDKKHLDHFFQVEITTKKGKRFIYPGIPL